MDTRQVVARFEADITIPVRILWGKQDTWIPTDIAHKLHGAIPGAPGSYVVILPAQSEEVAKVANLSPDRFRHLFVEDDTLPD